MVLDGREAHVLDDKDVLAVAEVRVDVRPVDAQRDVADARRGGRGAERRRDVRREEAPPLRPRLDQADVLERALGVGDVEGVLEEEEVARELAAGVEGAADRGGEVLERVARDELDDLRLRPLRRVVDGDGHDRVVVLRRDPAGRPDALRVVVRVLPLQDDAAEADVVEVLLRRKRRRLAGVVVREELRRGQREQVLRREVLRVNGGAETRKRRSASSKWSSSEW